MATTETTVALTNQAEQDLAYMYSPQKAMTETLTLVAFLFAVFYFMAIRPQQKRIKAHQAMLGALNKGDKVLTSGGLIGKLVKFEGDGDGVAVLEIAPGVQVHVSKMMISELVK